MNAPPTRVGPSPAHPPHPNFDPLARPYRVLESAIFGHALHRARTCLLPHLAPYRRALILGDGDGRFTASLLAHNARVHIDAVDLSPAMLRALTTRAQLADPAASRLRTFCMDALAFVPPPQTTYDLVVTHFFLDCLTTGQIQQLCRNLAPSLQPEAAWLLSDFRVPPGLLRLPARALVRSLYLAFRLLTGLRTTRLPDHAAALASAGFALTTQRLSLGGILTSELWQHPGTTSASRGSRSTLPTMPKPPTPPRHQHLPSDPVPDPEPPSPSLPEPDPGVFHHQPGPPAPPAPPSPTDARTP